MTKRFEDRLFAPSQSGLHKAIPALVITGFLGSGKTTLVQHLLRNRGQLRLAVLVNELGVVDIDSQLINTRQANAAVGLLTEEQLSGGCMCCAVMGDLRAALTRISASQGVDYLVLETSGASDAEPIAQALASHGFRLDCVVAVVDAEEGLSSLTHQVARQQVQGADVVIVNRCDVASLASASDVEDAVQRLVPGVRTLRARFCQVPILAVLDVEPSCTDVQEVNPSSTPANSHPNAAFLSHEPAPRQQEPTPRSAGGSRPVARLTASMATATTANDSLSMTPSSVHSHLHSGYHSVSVNLERPCSAPLFQAFVTDVLMKTPGLFRAKGMLWFAQAPAHCYSFHLSGRRRVDCRLDHAWDSPPCTQAVLIGSDLPVLAALRLQLLSTLAVAPTLPLPDPPHLPPPCGGRHSGRHPDPCTHAQLSNHPTDSAAPRSASPATVGGGTRNAASRGGGGSAAGGDPAAACGLRARGCCCRDPGSVTEASASAEGAVSELCALVTASAGFQLADSMLVGRGAVLGRHHQQQQQQHHQQQQQQQQQHQSVAGADPAKEHSNPAAHSTPEEAHHQSPQGQGQQQQQQHPQQRQQRQEAQRQSQHGGAWQGVSVDHALDGIRAPPSVAAGPAPACPLHTLQFSTTGSRLHGVDAAAMNAALMLSANAAGRVLLLGVPSPASLSSMGAQDAGRQHQPDRIETLVLLPPPQAQATDIWQHILDLAAPVITKAHQHVRHCACGV
ncbi:MAG: hypothetical protein WDW36_006133 [Sanguina aurantia]